MPLIKCLDCPVFFVRYNSRSVRCKACQSAHTAKTKMDWQGKHRGRPRLDMPDISEAEIEQRFTAALKQSRRQSSDSLEPFRSYGWLYREPRS